MKKKKKKFKKIKKNIGGIMNGVMNYLHIHLIVGCLGWTDGFRWGLSRSWTK